MGDWETDGASELTTVAQLDGLQTPMYIEQSDLMLKAVVIKRGPSAAKKARRVCEINGATYLGVLKTKSLP